MKIYLSGSRGELIDPERILGNGSEIMLSYHYLSEGNGRHDDRLDAVRKIRRRYPRENLPVRIQRGRAGAGAVAGSGGVGHAELPLFHVGQSGGAAPPDSGVEA